MGDGIQVYLDYNATAPVRPEALAAMTACLAETGNPSSVHRAGRRARQKVEAARQALAASISARPEEIVFTSGGTEANQLALQGTGVESLLVGSIEHESVLLPAARSGRPYNMVPVDRHGRLDLEALRDLLDVMPGPTLVSVMLANNEVGVIQPVAEAAAIVHAAGGLLHCDAIQALGKMPVDVEGLQADLLSLSAHKIGGPQGVGALYVADHVALEPMMRGGGQERGRRAGTENVAGIVGFGAAVRAADRGWLEQVAVLRDGLEARLCAAGGQAQGAAVPRLANTLAITMPGMPAETQVMAFDLAGFAVSAGAACSSGKVAPSHVLRAMGLADGVAGQTIRVSLGWGTTADEVERFASAWERIYTRAVARQRQVADGVRAAALVPGDDAHP